MLRTVIAGTLLTTAGLCYSFFAPTEKSDVEIKKGENVEIIATVATATPVPSPSPSTGPTPTPAAVFKVEKKKININTASAEELTTLSGIGELRAKCIVSYRTKNGEFKKIEDIMLVNGIKNGIFSKIKDRICTGYEEKETAGP